MDKFILIVNSIDWVFAGIILIGGRYWGSQFFSITKNKDVNFLGFATAFAIIWVIVKYYTIGVPKSEVGNLFITWLVTTAFYKILAAVIFEKIESVIPFLKKKKTETETQIIIKGGAVKDIKEIKPEEPKE